MEYENEIMVAYAYAWQYVRDCGQLMTKCRLKYRKRFCRSQQEAQRIDQHDSLEKPSVK